MDKPTNFLTNALFCVVLGFLLAVIYHADTSAETTSEQTTVVE